MHLCAGPEWRPRPPPSWERGRDSSRTQHPRGSSCGPGPGAPGRLLPLAQSFATCTGLNISVFQYFWSLSERSQPRLIGSSREETSCRKCPAILQPVLPMGNLKASLRDYGVAIILHVAYGHYSLPWPCPRLSGTAAALALTHLPRQLGGVCQDGSPRSGICWPGPLPPCPSPDIATCLHLRPFP